MSHAIKVIRFSTLEISDMIQPQKAVTSLSVISKYRKESISHTIDILSVYATFAAYELAFWLSAIDHRYAKRQDCLNNILCECNRKSCPFRQVSVITYARKLKAKEQLA